MDEPLQTEPRSRHGSIGADLTSLGDTDAVNQALIREIQSLRDEGAQIKEKLAALERGYLAMVEQAGALDRSMGGILIHQARKIRRRIFREGRLSGRCWNLFSRFTKTAIKSGPRVAVRKAVGKIRGKIARTLATHGTRGQAEDATTIGLTAFLDLPWKYLGDGASEAGPKSGHFKVLLVSHSACRTGAPLCLLKLAERLTQLPDVDCRIILKKGGELADAFARLAPTLDLGALDAQGPDISHMPGILARAYRDYSSRGIAICNTIAVSEFHPAFSEHKIPVLSWLHELPVSIDQLGGKTIIDRIASASARIMVPANVVRDTLIARYAIVPDRLRTVYYGLEPRTRDLAEDRQAIRRRVRQELGIPEDAPIVLGCGTTELRKGVDLFAQLCRRVLTASRPGEPASDAWFVWVGVQVYNDFQQWLVHDSQYGTRERRLVFAGPREDTVPYFLAADLFALTSREDPCPFVNLEAMESGLAVVAFEDSGGAPEVLKEAGACVPHLEVAAMANAARELLNDPERRAAMGRLGQASIRGYFTWDRFMEDFRGILRNDFGYHPAVPFKVSVVVPNYRHSRFLEQRLRSIFSQTIQPHEIIFLDNASPDDSVEVARRLSIESPVPMKIVVNERNNGSTFKQWMKGLSLATGDLVWIAEADDACRPQLLERLVPEFYDPEVVLAYCQSATIGPDGEVLSEHFLDHTNDLSRDRWQSHFSVLGDEEVERALSQKNSIPNASAVLFRRPPGRPDFADELEDLRFAGDWLFYAMQLRGGKISYVPDVLNLFRRHPQTNTHQVVREDSLVEETLYVKARVFETFPASMNAIASSMCRSVVEYNDLTRQFDMKRPVFTANLRARSSIERIRQLLRLRERRDAGGRAGLKVLLVLGDLGRSGSHTAAIRLANGLSANHQVFLCNARPSEWDAGLAAVVNPEVVLLEGTLGPHPWAVALDPPGAESLSGQSRRCEILRELVRFHQIDVIHSISPAADRLAFDLKEDLDIPWFSHLDGSRGGDASLDRSILSQVLTLAAGVFHDRDADVRELRSLAHSSGTRLIGLPAALDVEQIASICSGAYADACELRARQAEEATLPIPRETASWSPRQSA